MEIGKIRSAEKILFWIERAAILLFVLFGGTPRFLRCSLGLFAFTNLYYVSLAYHQRLFVTPQPNEPSNALFVFDRYAMWLVAIHFFTGSPAYRYLAAAVFVISNTNLIMKALGVKSNQILYCNPTKDDKEREREKTKHDEIEEIPETETIDEMEERATLVVDNINITEKEIAGNKEEDDDEEDYEIVSYKKEVKDQESQETGDGRCCETNRVFLSSMQREDDDVGLLKELNGENCELMKDLADKLLVLEQENEVLSRKLSAESASSTERLNQIVYEYERICRRLEEEKAALNASLSTAQADSDFYRECMFDLSLSY
ncbi:kinesin-related protein [Salix suchowensis]|nr:kinesin-related protein [Salix suchowensis]